MVYYPRRMETHAITLQTTHTTPWNMSTHKYRTVAEINETITKRIGRTLCNDKSRGLETRSLVACGEKLRNETKKRIRDHPSNNGNDRLLLFLAQTRLTFAVDFSRQHRRLSNSFKTEDANWRKWNEMKVKLACTCTHHVDLQMKERTKRRRFLPKKHVRHMPIYGRERVCHWVKSAYDWRAHERNIGQTEGQHTNVQL